jgi:hypothetical protein
MKVICSEVGYRHDCDKCGHGKAHEAMKDCDKKSGYCWIGTHDRIDVVCKLTTEHSKGE